MSDYIQTISFKEAEKMSERAAFEQLEPFMNDSEIDVLEKKFFEAECCWFFFRNRQIEGPSEYNLRWSRAYAVSKKGELRLIVDFWDEPDKLKQYLLTMSNHFKEKKM